MNSRFDRLSLLETFLRVAERGSLSGAARDLGTSQPSVSRQLAALETRLGTVLARRTTHNVTLTADGLTLLEDARRMIGEWEAIEERHAEDGSLTGVIRVIAPIALGQRLFLEPVARFMADHPGITVEWRLADGAIRFAEEGCDCWLKVGPVPDDTLVVKELTRVERIVVGRREHGTRKPGDALNTLPWLTLGPFEGNGIELFDQAGRQKRFSVAPRLASDNIFAIHDAVRRGVGVAILPRWFVVEELSSGTLTDIVPGWQAAKLSVNLAMAAGTKRPARVDRFCAAMQDWCRDQLGPTA